MQGAPPTLEKIGGQLQRKIADLEKRLEDLDDDMISEWDDAQGDVDLEKVELQERIVFLEAQQIKVLARYEKMRLTLSTVSEQVFGLKQKLRYHKSDAIHNMVKALCQSDLPLPEDVEVLQEIAMALKVENRVLEKLCPMEKTDTIPLGNMHLNATHNPNASRMDPVSPRGNRNPTGEPSEETNQNLVLNKEEIVAGTIPQLLGCLLSKVNPDKAFEADFLCTYHAFLSGTLLLQNLSQRFQNSGDKSQQLRVFNIVNAWIQSNPLDIRDDHMLRDHMIEFIQTMAGVVSKMQTKKLLTLLEKKINATPSAPVIHKLPDIESVRIFLKYDSRELARQMTLHDLKLYQMIDPRDAMKDPEGLLISKRIKKVENWVDREVKKSKKKSLVIKKLVEVIYHCSRLRNFHTTFVLLDAVCNADDRKSVMKGIKKIPELSSLVEGEGDFHVYRTFIKERKLSAIPNFKFQMAKLLETKDEPQEIVQGETKLINFAKYRPAGQTIQEIQFFQRSSYPRIEVESTTLGYIQSLP